MVYNLMSARCRRLYIIIIRMQIALKTALTIEMSTFMQVSILICKSAKLHDFYWT